MSVQPPEKIQARERAIRAKSGQDLQHEIEVAVNDGFRLISLEGEFRIGGKEQFSLIRVKSDWQIEIIGKNAVIDGVGVAHLLYVEDGARVAVSGVTITNGYTANLKAMLSKQGHPGESLNYFRYVDGGAVIIGEGANVSLHDCSFVGNRAAICGGAVSNQGGLVYIEDCDFDDNVCGDTGAAIDNLVAGSLAVVRRSRFAGNKANSRGGGNYGAITIFPETFAIIDTCNFVGQELTAIDYADGSEIHLIHNQFNPATIDPVIRNPFHGRGVRQKILLFYALLLAQRYGYLSNFGRVPRASQRVINKHRDMYLQLTGSG